MSKQLMTTALLFFFSSIFFNASGQGKNYGILLLDKDKITSLYADKVAYLVFQYKHPLFASRKLECTPFTADGVPMASFKPKKVYRHNKQRLVNNFFDGLLTLTIQKMKDSEVDGAFDLYLIPRPCDECNNPNYVSYLIDSSISSITNANAQAMSPVKERGLTYSGPGNSVPFKTVFRPLAFKSIVMNPSPPYVSGP